MTDPFYDGKDPDFGSVYPEGHVPGEDHEPVHKDKRPRPKGIGAALHGPALRWLNETYPGSWWAKGEGYRYVGGNYVKSDFAGFGDFIGCVEGRMVVVQVTTLADVGPHLVKYTSARSTHGPNKTPIGTLLRGYLRSGGQFVILGFAKEKNRWECTPTHVTEDTLNEVCSRAKGRQTA